MDERLPESPPRAPTRVLGIVTILFAAAVMAFSLHFHCGKPALEIGAFSLSDGAVMGALLALVTRTQKPALIYLFLALAALTMWPIAVSWPPVHAHESEFYSEIPSAGYAYLDAIRTILYIAGMPYLFARLGFHAPDQFLESTQYRPESPQNPNSAETEPADTRQKQ